MNKEKQFKIYSNSYNKYIYNLIPKNKKILISVVMPVYNSGELIHQTIKSILTQTYTNFEFIIINDASTDNTLKVVKEYAKKDNRIKIINNKTNLGIALASNKGLDAAKGKYIAMMDHDDISLPQRFEKQVEFLEKNKDVFLLGTKYEHIDINNKKIITMSVVTNPDKLKKYMITGRPKICHPSIMFRNKTKIRYRSKIYYAQDYDFFLQLLSDNKKLSNLDEVLFKYRIHNTQTSMQKRDKQYLFSRKAIEFYWQRIKFGIDNYNEFNPNTILNFDFENTIDKDVITAKMLYYYNLEDYKLARKYIFKYFKLYGVFNKFLIYYILSLFPKTINEFFLNLNRKYRHR